MKTRKTEGKTQPPLAGAAGYGDCRIALNVKLDMEEIAKSLTPEQTRAIFAGIGEVQAAVSHRHNESSSPTAAGGNGGAQNK